jgi:hypothetical protein
MNVFMIEKITHLQNKNINISITTYQTRFLLSSGIVFAISNII